MNSMNSMNNISFLILILLLIILLLVYRIDYFGNIYSGTTSLSVSSSDGNANLNYIPINIKYVTPGNYINTTNFIISSGTLNSEIRFYKWPLVYMFDPSQVPPPSGVTYNAAYFNDSNNGYTLLSISNLTNNIASMSGQYNGPTTFPILPLKFPNIINLSKLLDPDAMNASNNLGTYPDELGFNAVSTKGVDLVDINTQMSYIIPGNNIIIPAPLTLNRDYVLGIAIQLNVDRVVSDALSPSYLKKRYGQFKYVDIKITNDNLKEANAGLMSQAFTINMGQIIA